jgi:hypothetical protein
LHIQPIFAQPEVPSFSDFKKALVEVSEQIKEASERAMNSKMQEYRREVQLEYQETVRRLESKGCSRFRGTGR